METLYTNSVPPALTLGKNIFLAECPPNDYLPRYLHESGHVLARQLSFRSGQVLTPQETYQHSVTLSVDQSEWLLANFGRKTNLEAAEVPIASDIANILLAEFTKGEFSSGYINIFYRANTKEILRQYAPPLIKIDIKKQRDVEIPAYYTQVGCLNILANSLPAYRLPIRPEDLTLPNFPPHRRALRIVHRAYQRGWLLPSMTDRQAA